MKEFTIYNAVGEIVRSGCCQETTYDNQAHDGELIIEGDFSSSTHYIFEGVPTLKDPKPSENYDWDATGKVWIQNLERAKFLKKAEIEVMRDSLIYANIVYDGHTFQADERSVTNIRKKLDEIAAAEALEVSVSPLFWRDYDNNIYYWIDLQTYKTWLNGFVVTIAARMTTLIEASFTHKSAVTALETVSAVEAYDIADNWL